MLVDTPSISTEDLAESLLGRIEQEVGDMTYVHFELGGVDMTATVSGDIHVQVDKELDIVFPEERLHVFDQETKEAIKNSRRELLSMPS